MIGPARTAWTAVHVLYTSPSGRREFLTEHLGRIPRPALKKGSWFFADLAAASGPRGRGRLEIAVQASTGVPLHREAVRGLVRSLASPDLIEEVVDAGRPWALHPRLFPHGVAPESYPAALSIGSIRALRILQAVRAANGEEVPEATVREEVAFTYRSLHPFLDEIGSAMLEHAAWLERAAARSGVRSENPAAVEPRRTTELSHPLPPGAGYGSLGRELWDHVSASTVDPGRGDPPGSDTRRDITAIVARLAHTQVVRLWDPTGREGLLREARLLRDLHGSYTR